MKSHNHTIHCAGVKPEDRDSRVVEVELVSPKGRLVVLVCQLCWHISDDAGETWGTPCAFIPGWHPFTEDVVLGGTMGVQICCSCSLVTADCGETWLKSADMLPRDLPRLADVLPPVTPRVASERARAFRLRRPRAVRLYARAAGL